MQSRFLPWAGCTISDLKLTHSSAQGESQQDLSQPRASNSSSIQTDIPLSRSLCTVRNWDNFDTATPQNVRRSLMNSLPGAGLGRAQCPTLGSHTCLQHPAVISRPFPAGTQLTSERCRWDQPWTSTWAPVILQSCTVSHTRQCQSVVTSLRASKGSHSPAAAPAAPGISKWHWSSGLAAPSCHSWALSSQTARAGVV